MKKLLVPFCLTLIIFIGSAGVGWSASLKKDLYAERRGDCATVLREFIPLAEQKIVTPQAILGLMYREGQGLPQDYKTAVKWLKLAAEPGDACAQAILGLMYDWGEGVPENDKTAVKWLKLAAEQGVATAQHHLGLMYQSGSGVPENQKTAVKWLKLAAEQGDAYPESQQNLAFRYEDGRGVKKDLVYAYMWHSISKTNGLVEPGDMGMLMLEFEMTPSQIETAKKLARECVRKNYKSREGGC